MQITRLEQIENYITENKTVSLDTLCDVFNISKNTVRRDIEKLSLKGTIKKVYGGVTVNSSTSLISYNDRNISSISEKCSIGRSAASLVNDGDVIFIDSGTTTVNLIDNIKDKKNISVFTNNLDVIIRSVQYDNINVTVLGGTLTRKTYSISGIDAAQILNKYNISKAFMAAGGFSIENGATNSSPLEYEVKKVVMKKSIHKYLLMDSSKFDTAALMTYATSDEFEIIVTNSLPSKKFIDYFERVGTKLFISK